MRVAICTSIFPPDVGGPATHARDLSVELATRGHRVTVLTLADAAVADPERGFVALRRDSAWPVRLARVFSWLLGNRSRFDVIYATGLQGPAVLAAKLARKPIVVKVVGDPAWERARRLGSVSAGFDQFQAERRGPIGVALMRAFRSWWTRSATAVTVPSDYLHRTVCGWGAPPERVRTIPNGVRLPSSGDPAPRSDGGFRLIYVGRLIPHKRLDVVLEAVARLPGVSLEVVGEGPERAAISGLCDQLELDGRVALTGRLDHEAVLERLRLADALVLASEYEGMPHVAVEALACGTPVLAPRVGGVDEVVSSGENGLLYEPVEAGTLASSIARLADDRRLYRTLSQQARESVEELRFERCADRIEALLSEACSRPAVVMLGKSRMVKPADRSLKRKLGVLSRHLRVVSISAGRWGWRRQEGVTLVTIPTPGLPGRVSFYLIAPFLAMCLALSRGAAIVCQSPFEAAVVAAIRAPLPRRRRPPLVVEVHGEWQASARLYGSGLRRLVAPLADRVAARAILSADRVRTISDHLEERIRAAGWNGPIDRYMTWTDFTSFLKPPPQPLPRVPHAAFVGVLEPHKGVDVLLRAWRDVTARVPEAKLTVLGQGARAADLRDLARRLHIEDSVRFERTRTADGVRELLDHSTCLVLPSRSEGLGRVAFEAMARARPVIGTAVGGIPELVREQQTGVLVAPGDPHALADALKAVLRDSVVSTRMGEKGRELALSLDPLGGYEEGTARLADWISAQRPGGPRR